MTVQIVAIVDRSGSMASKRSDAIGGFNTFIEEQRKAGDDAEVTLVLFDHMYEIPFYRIPLKDVKQLDNGTFVPRGGTALNDAIGKTVEKFKEIHLANKDSINGVMVAILTDGDENSSHQYSTEQIKGLTTLMESDHNWKFVYLAANQDAFSVGQAYGINTTLNFSDDGVGVQAAYKSLSASTSSYRASVGNITLNDVADFKAKIQPV